MKEHAIAIKPLKLAKPSIGTHKAKRNFFIMLMIKDLRLKKTGLPLFF